MFRSLYSKITLTTIVIIFASSLLAFLISNTYYHQQIKPYNDQKNTLIALDITDFVKKNQQVELDDYLEHIAAIGYQIYLVDTEGRESYFGAPFRKKELSAYIIEKVLAGEMYHGMALFPQETFMTGFFANELSNTIGVPLETKQQKYALFLRPDIKLLFTEIHTLLACLLVLTISLSIIFVIISTKFLIDPLSKLKSATTEIAQGNFSIQLDIERKDELGDLAHSFTQMASKLAKMDTLHIEFISNIAHDLQSPLTNIQGYTTLLIEEKLPVEESKHYLQIINEEAKRLSTLAKQYLLLATLEHQQQAIHKQHFDVAKQLKGLIRNYQWQLSERGLMVDYTLPYVEVKADPTLLYIVWENLLTNAIKYNTENGEIHISLQEKGNELEVSFTDTGIGLEQAEVEQIFDRLYRGDQARSPVVKGTGLGLSIAFMIVGMHGGRIDVQTTKGKGATFTVTLPKM